MVSTKTVYTYVVSLSTVYTYWDKDTSLTLRNCSCSQKLDKLLIHMDPNFIPPNFSYLYQVFTYFISAFRNLKSSPNTSTYHVQTSEISPARVATLAVPFHDNWRRYVPSYPARCIGDLDVNQHRFSDYGPSITPNAATESPLPSIFNIQIVNIFFLDPL